MSLSILYRGPLSSCNYACGYCPFAKRDETYEQLAEDRRALARFVDWAAGQTDRSLEILFTPWGEALIRKWYQDALATLSQLPHVVKVAIQTNLSCPFDWIDRCKLDRLALWATYHPGEIARERFVERCRELAHRGVRFSVGVVGLAEHRQEIEALRRELPAETYLWINAYKRDPNYYDEQLLRLYESIDPLFRINTIYHESLGHSCRAGETVISVDGRGDVRRCHFIAEVIGNIYEPSFGSCLVERPCANQTCGCHIGYVHLRRLKLYDVFVDGVLERIPMEPLWQSTKSIQKIDSSL